MFASVRRLGTTRRIRARPACRGIALLAVLAACGLVPRAAMAQSAVAQSAVAPGVVAQSAVTPSAPAPGAEAAPDTAPAGNASALLSATKATTYKIGTALTNLLILGAGTGVVGGVVLTAFVTTESWLVYGVNDYLWDTYAPKPAPRPDGSFDAAESAWRSTEKWLTYKPVVAAAKFGAIYVWTGSVPIMLTLGTATILANTGVFYANSMGWDLYEWWTTPLVGPVAPNPAVPNPAVPNPAPVVPAPVGPAPGLGVQAAR
jgi:hypothetical protein